MTWKTTWRTYNCKKLRTPKKPIFFSTLHGNKELTISEENKKIKEVFNSKLIIKSLYLGWDTNIITLFFILSVKKALNKAKIMENIDGSLITWIALIRTGRQAWNEKEETAAVIRPNFVKIFRLTIFRFLFNLFYLFFYLLRFPKKKNPK